MKKYWIQIVFVCGLLTGCAVSEDAGDCEMVGVNNSDPVEKELIDLELNGQKVVVEKVDGQLIFQGDIVFDEDHSMDSCTRGAGLVPWSFQKWTNNSVFYVIDSSIPDSRVILAAIKDWQKNSNLTFFPRIAQSNYIRFVRSATVNNSYVGMRRGEQIINLYNYNNFGTVAHEIGHALGLWHEHTRADRDNHILIDWSNIKEGSKHNFYIYDSGMDYGPFDFNSIMIYGSYITDLNMVYDPAKPVMTKLDRTTFEDGNVISEGDRYAIQTIYPTVKIYGDATWKPVPADYDGDGRADLSVKTDDGYWLIDYARNGYGKWDEVLAEYGFEDAVPAVADYDGDGKADLSVKDAAGGWYIDYAKDGFGGWNAAFSSYGGSFAIPVPADYDGDGKADLSIKTNDGKWFIDYSNNGFRGWDVYLSSYGFEDAVPAVADYDGDGKADLSVKDAAGGWYIDYAKDGFGGWNAAFSSYGGSFAVPVPADYDGDGKADLSIKTDDGKWCIDYSNNGFRGWDVYLSGYGESSAIPVPTDYDGDGKDDLAGKNDTGQWYLDYAADGFGGWNWSSSN
ncbi:M12 family metallopeptidase [Alistipes sp.]|uniref:M12 family metallopeptidase n=1 Tax=Alistipes sp. TaxID=1872444 RepID=UPI003AF16B1A